MGKRKKTSHSRKVLSNFQIYWNKELVLAIIALVLSAIALVGNFLN